MEKQHVVIELETYDKFKKTEEELAYSNRQKSDLESKLFHLQKVLFESFSRDFTRQDSLQDFLHINGLQINFENKIIAFKP